MSYKSLYIFRHGEVDYQFDSFGQRLIYPSDAPLGINGRERVGKIADRLKKKLLILDGIYTGSSRRVMDTAQLLGEKICVSSPVILGSLRDVYEAASQEEWVGRSKVEFDVAMNINGLIPEEETVARLNETLTLILNNPLLGNIGIVTHGNTAKLLMFLLEHPGEKIPTLGEIKKRYPLERSECWKLVINDAGRVLEKERIIPEGFSQGESEISGKGKERK